MFKAYRARESSKAENKGKRELRKAAAEREKKNQTEMMRETVWGRRRILSLLQAAREDMEVAVVEIATRLALRYPRQ